MSNARSYLSHSHILSAIILLGAMTFFDVGSLSANEGKESSNSSACVAKPQPDMVWHSRTPIVPLPRSISLNPRKVALGKALFYDKRFSKDNSTSCESCHNLNTNGADTHRYSTGWGGDMTDVNTPTVFNSGFNFTQFWNGRAATLEEQVGGPIHNNSELGSNWPMVLQKLGADPSLKRLFFQIYDDGLTRENIKDSIATFERSLITPNSRFDNYLRGDEAAITAEEKTGYALFKSLGCAACHQGRNVGGNLFQRLGIFNSYFNKDNKNKADLGRYNVTQDERDIHVFKVPSLRNIALTAPYLHDGSVETLGAVVQIMAHHQLGLRISENNTNCIVAFLETLTGEKSWVQK